MIDLVTHKPLHVLMDEVAGPYLMAPVDQLVSIEFILRHNAVFYWVDDGAVSLNKKPAVTVINFGPRDRAELVQRLLDAAA